MPSNFDAEEITTRILPPKPVRFDAIDPKIDPEDAEYFSSGKVGFYNVPEAVSGAQCYYAKPPSGTE